MYGADTDAYTSRGIFLLASPQGTVTVTEAARPFRYLPEEIRHAVTDKLGMIFPADTAAFMKALIIGDTAGISGDKVLSGALSATGTAHIISVSGMNVAFLMGVLGVLIKKQEAARHLRHPRRHFVHGRRRLHAARDPSRDHAAVSAGRSAF